jgi:phage terminase large subunit-like protein
LISGWARAKWAEQNIILSNGKPIAWEKHQRKILDHGFRVDAEGKLKYSIIVYSCPKKGGKTTVGDTTILWFAFELAPGTEIILAANDLEQSTSRAFKEAKKMIERNPRLRSRVSSMTAREIVLVNGTSIKAIPNDASGEAGSNHSLVHFDELWGYTLKKVSGFMKS